MDLNKEEYGKNDFTWIETYSGKKFDVLNPRSDDVCILDIATSLSKLCRYIGHTTRMYSVAEHCIHLANAVPTEYRLAALLHDSAEAYLGDIATPIKPLIQGYEELEQHILKIICDKYNVEYPIPTIVDIYDKHICMDERCAIKTMSGNKWIEYVPLGIEDNIIRYGNSFPNGLYSDKKVTEDFLRIFNECI